MHRASVQPSVVSTTEVPALKVCEGARPRAGHGGVVVVSLRVLGQLADVSRGRSAHPRPVTSLGCAGAATWTGRRTGVATVLDVSRSAQCGRIASPPCRSQSGRDIGRASGGSPEAAARHRQVARTTRHSMPFLTAPGIGRLIPRAWPRCPEYPTHVSRNRTRPGDPYRLETRPNYAIGEYR